MRNRHRLVDSVGPAGVNLLSFIARWWSAFRQRLEFAAATSRARGVRPAHQVLSEKPVGTAKTGTATGPRALEDVDVPREEPIIRPMFISDLDQVLLVETHSFATPWSRAAFYGELLENPRARYLVAVNGRRVAGYIGLWLILDEAHITNVAVHPDYRGRGIGRMLMMQAEKVAAANGARRMTLEVRKSNIVAQNLYRSLGYYSVGVRPGYYRDNNEDAIIMWKDGVAKGDGDG